MSVHLLISMGDQVMSCDMQRVVRAVRVHLQRYPHKPFRLIPEERGAAGDEAAVSVQRAVCTGMSV